ncbi:hypothetical protein CONPUDRAFT_156551 [Coniophora puteana RWD-64-598 SS2]|uniref:F-box domain-containing protein n=1 Tax=Coniophora puteana (strain RWD-64-598) TaxID=741705 RepID=A0A5M3MIG3_CONPW|nr:uncharacterized protein CONPUDRAFT_156551 [Coniophora puteana RWD-64-598 SS2]EIW78574.1 hypothetical protein CONPUDRAFT_156551 [Coniophora puteana RWD-64-598 SS2]
MHQALLISEVLNVVLRCVKNIIEYRDLAILARTCKAFQEPALDVLWEQAWHLPRLLNVIPERVLIDVKPLTSAEWSYLYAYTRRMREIILSEWDPTPSFILDLLYDPPPHLGAHAFPRLRRLRIDGYRTGKHRIPDYRFLLVPTLETVEMRSLRPGESKSGSQTKKVIMSLPEACPALKNLTITWGDQTADVPVGMLLAVEEAVGRLDQLEVLQCPAPTGVEGMVALGKLARLEVLMLDSPPPISGNLIAGKPVKYEFAELHSLDFETRNMEDVNAFLSQLGRLPDGLKVQYHTAPSLSELESFFAHLTTLNNPDVSGITLDKARIGSAADDFLHLAPLLNHDDPASPPLTLATLKPLMSFTSLCTLDITVPLRVILTDDDIEELSCAWPHLRHFSINEHRGWGSGALLTTIESLYSLVWNCPDLEHIAMPIDASALIEVPDEVPAGGARNDRAFQVHMGASRVGDPVVLVIVLAQIFEGRRLRVGHRHAEVAFDPAATWHDGSGEKGLARNYQMAMNRCMRELREIEKEDPEVFGDEDVWPPHEDLVEEMREVFAGTVREFAHIGPW